MQKEQKIKLDTDFSFFTKIYSKWIIDLNVRHNYKILEYNIGGNLGDLRFGDDFLDSTLKA